MSSRSAASALRVEPALESDWATVASIERRAFAPSIINQKLWSKVDPATADEYRVRSWKKTLNDPLVRYQKAVLVGGDPDGSDKTVGIAIWWLPGRVPLAEESESPPEFPPGANIELAKQFFASMSNEYTPSHYHLIVLAVDPDHQRQGVGQALLKWGIDLSDKDGHSIFLEASDVGIGAYLKAGFYPIRQPIVSGPEGAFVVTPMHRPSSLDLSPTSSKLLIQPALPSDLPRIAQVHYSAFLTSSFTTVLFAKTTSSDLLADALKRYQKMLKEDFRYRVFKAIDRSTGEIVGAATWKSPQKPGTPDEPLPKKEDFPVGMDYDLGMTFFGMMHAAQGVERKRSLELSLLVVDPERQRVGIGRELIRWGLKKADEEGLDVTLDATKAGVELYESYQFYRDLPPIKAGPENNPLVLYPMIRPSRTCISPSPSISITRATLNDLPSIARLRRESFEPSLIHQTLFSKTDSIQFDEFTVRRSTKLIDDGKAAIWVARREGSEEIVGFSSWDLPGFDEEEQEQKEKEQEWTDWKEMYPPGSEHELAAEFFGKLGKAGGSRRILLGTLCVDPKAQSTGIGSALLQWGIDRSDRDGVDCYLDASIVGIPAYKKAGFKLFGEPIRGGRSNELVLYPMRRRPGLKFDLAISSDTPQLAKIHRAAFLPSKIHEVLFSRCDPEEHVRSIVSYFDRLMKSPHTVVWKAIRAGEVAGFAIWERPHVAETKDGKENEKGALAEEKPRYPAGAEEELAKEFFGRHDLGIEEPHYHLAILSVDPSLQKSGVGSALLRWGCEQADKEGVPVYLESTPVGVRTYELASFQHTLSPIHGGRSNELVTYPMVRHPLLVVAALTQEDIAALSQVHRLAWSRTRFFQSIYANVEGADFEAWHSKRAQGWLTDGEDKARVMLAKRGDEVLGYAYWQLSEGTGDFGEEPINEFPQGTNLKVAQPFFKECFALDASIQGKHWHLELLAVNPLHRGQGIAQSLVRWGMRETQKRGIPIYVESTEEGLNMYLKLGLAPSGASPLKSVDGSFTIHPLYLPALTTSTLAALNEKDLISLSEIHYDAFFSTELFKGVFAGATNAQWLEWYLKRAATWFDNPNQSIVTVKRGELMIGYARWEVCHPPTAKTSVGEGTKERPAKLLLVPKGTNEELVRAFFGDLAKFEETVQGEKHYHLHILATSPKYQKTGAGSLLLKWGTEQARAEGLAAYLEATVEGVPVYERGGWKKCAEPIVARNGSAAVTPMIWRA